MPLYQKAFWTMSFFLIGVFAISSVSDWQFRFGAVALGALLLATGLLLFQRYWLAVLSLSLILGAGYYSWHDLRYQNSFSAPFGSHIEFSGLVTRVSRSGQAQSVDIDLAPPHTGAVRATLEQYPTLSYGDMIRLSGILRPIDGASAQYFAKEGIGATVSFPKKVEIIGQGEGNSLKAALLAVRDRVEASFTRVLPPESATLMTGLVLGKSGGFSKEFTEKLKITGTTHLVALSGYNITVLISGLLFMLGFFINRRYAVWLCVAAILGFVVMTGAEASVVRAALMATIVVVAERAGRMHSMRNAVAATATVMVLVNPKVLAFDIGFQLSFLALLGIVYLQPAIERFFRLSEESGFLGWRKNLTTTLAAQIAVLPILLANFGSFAPLAIVTNVLLLTFVPYTMLLGFCIVIASFISSYLALVVALPAKLLLGYELGVINLFSKIPFSIQLEHFPMFLGTLYYAAVFLFIIYATRRSRTRSYESL